MTETFIAATFAALALAATAYYLSVIAACAKFGRRAAAPPAVQPPISILKPVRGLDPRFEDNLRAHLEQDYPELEILVGAADADDPALEAARRVAAAYPHRSLRTIVCGAAGAGNRKVAILEGLEPHATHDLLLVDDADIRPDPRWLAETAAPLAEPSVGLATCLYRARPGSTLGSKIDALWISADFPGQALTAAELLGISFALGAAMLFRRGDLARIGGFSAVRPYLADDYQLGVRIAGLGRRTLLSPSVVETVAGEASLGEVWRRHLRWSRTVRVSRPGGRLGLLVTFGAVWSAALLAAAGFASPWAWPAYVCLLARCTAAAVVARTVRAKLGSSWLLLPLADLWAFAIWLAGSFGNTVMWRGQKLRLDGLGRILPRE